MPVRLDDVDMLKFQALLAPSKGALGARCVAIASTVRRISQRRFARRQNPEEQRGVTHPSTVAAGTLQS